MAPALLRLLANSALILPLCVTPTMARSAQPVIPGAEISTLAVLYAQLRKSLAYPPEDNHLLVEAMRAMVQAADPEGGEFFTPAEFAELKAQQSSDQGELGLEVVACQGELVLAPVDSGPAAMAGLRRGDRLLAIDNNAVTGGQLQQVKRKLIGPSKTSVALRIARGNASPITITVERRPLEPKRATISRPAPDIVQLVLPPFNADTLEDAASKLQREWDKRPFRSLIVDLRGNSGGRLDVALALTSVFLAPDTLLATTTGRAADAAQEFRASTTRYASAGAQDLLARLPEAMKNVALIVLVDEKTASGAELVAAVWRDHGRATLVGRKTYGRASIQTVVPLPEGAAVKFTTAYWVSPSGERLHKVGVTPHIIVEDTDPAAALAKAINLLQVNR